MNYHTKYIDYLKWANVDVKALNPTLLDAIVHFEVALATLSEATNQQQEKYLPIIVQTDSYLSACIYNQFKAQINQNKPNEEKVIESISEAEKAKRMRLLKLKAKALKLTNNE